MNKITLKWEEILAGATSGLMREIESLRQGIEWGHGANFNHYEKCCMTISGALAEMSLAKMCQSYFSHSVNNFHGADLKINGKSVQVRSQLMSKKTHNLIVRQNKKKDDYYFLMLDEFPTYRHTVKVRGGNDQVTSWLSLRISGLAEVLHLDFTAHLA